MAVQRERRPSLRSGIRAPFPPDHPAEQLQTRPVPARCRTLTQIASPETCDLSGTQPVAVAVTRRLRHLLQPTPTPPRARRPHEVFNARLIAHPRASIPTTHFRVRHDKVDRHGSITIRYHSELHHIGMGARHRSQPVVMLIADRDIRIVTPDGQPLRHLTLDPTRDYQPQTSGWGQGAHCRGRRASRRK
jgi:hypothetical protein